MSYCRLLFLVLLFSCSLFAQFHQQVGTVQVRVTFTDGKGCNVQAHLKLMSGSSNTPVHETYTNDQCMGSFNNLAVGTYNIVVTGDGLEETNSGVFDVDERKSSQYLFISVKRTGEDAAAQPQTSATVSAGALNIPPDAQKAFDKANELIAKEKWEKAKDSLTKALAIYPQYAAAYNNLGVVEGRLGDGSLEQADLQKAIQLDEHFAPAYVNLGKFSIKQNDFPAAENYLGKAVAAGASDAPTLTLLANTELLDQHFEQAVATCHTLHEGPQSPHALCHYIAARAQERQNHMADARSELQLFLSEEPSGVRADHVRQELALLQKN